MPVRALVGISSGLFFGAALGTALHNLGVETALGVNVIAVAIVLGASLGAVLGAALAITRDAASTPNRAFDKPVSYPLDL